MGLAPTNSKRYTRRHVAIGLVLTALVVGSFFFVFIGGEKEYVRPRLAKEEVNAAATVVPELPEEPEVVHVQTPDVVKGIYMTSWVGGVKNAAGEYYWRDALTELIEETELNAIVVDIKDDTGRLSFAPNDPELILGGAGTTRIPDIEEYLKELHDKNIYVIGRIAVFQDPYLVENRPDLALKNNTNGLAWKDRRGLAWVDPASRDVWEYVLRIARESYLRGFDEIQFDYVRFPTDGSVASIAYPFFDPLIGTKRDTINTFFTYLGEEMRKEGIPSSVDLFGQTTTDPGDMGIGQMLEDAALNVDFVSPMVYPSHYINNFGGFENPNLSPGPVVEYAMTTGATRLTAASTSPLKLRPWLQDFDYGGTYDAAAVRAQIDAVYAAGLTSWLLWDPAVKYTREALQPE